MDVILDILTNAEYDLARALMAALLLLLLPTLFFFIARVRSREKAGAPIPLRPLKAFESLTKVMGLSAESGRPLHISLGTGGIGDLTTTESMAALAMLDYFSEKAVAYGIQPLVTTADPTLLLAAQDRIRQAFAKRGRMDAYSPTQVRLVAPDRTAYAASVMDILKNDSLSGNVMVGAFGDEYLLVGEVGARQDMFQVAGAADPSVLPFVYATSDRPLLGEEMFAAGAYLGRLPAHIGSLLAHDWVRVLLIVIIVAGTVVKSFT